MHIRIYQDKQHGTRISFTAPSKLKLLSIKYYKISLTFLRGSCGS